MKINFLTIALIIYAATVEHDLKILTFNVRISQLFALFIVLYNFDRFILKNFQPKLKVILCYFLIILLILLNDLVVGTKFLYSVNSIFFFIISLILFIFFLNIFLKNENYFAKFFLILSISLIIYKGENFILFPMDTLAKADAIYGTRYSAPLLYFTLGISYYLIIKKNLFFFIIINLLYIFLSFYFWSFSSIYINTTTLLLFLFIIIFNFKILYLKIIYIFLVCFFLLDIFYLQILFTDLASFLFAKRPDAFIFIPNILENFPFGIGSKNVIGDYFQSFSVVKNFFGHENSNIGIVSNENYTSTHSMIMEMLLRYGFFATLPFIYLFYDLIKNITKILNNKIISKGVKFYTVYILSFFSYAFFFNGIGSFLVQFPLYYAFIISIKENYKL